MRIVQFTDCYLPRLGGIETHVAELARQQAAAGHEVAIFTTTPAAPGSYGRTAEREGDVRVFRASAPMPGGVPVHPLAPRHLADLVGALDPDVVHVHMGGITPSVQLSLPSLRTYPTLLTLHSVWTPALTTAYRALATLTGFARWSPTLSAVSEGTAARLHAATGQEVHLLRNGVDLAPWRGSPLPHDGVHVVAATRFSARKRVLPLLEILRHAGERIAAAGGTPLRATIAGDGPQFAEARAFVADHGMEWVELPGRLTREELQRLYRAADVYLCPTILEAFSVAILEARAAGLALVIRSESGSAEGLVSGDDGLIADDDAGLADAVVRLATQPELLTHITTHNRENPPPYDWPVVLARHEELYVLAARSVH